ncbi:DNA gyrase subunit B [Streptomyces sp. HUAS MG47]|uniref:DNA gyrase subunit B n=1 Tax=Streptomyces solicamelliae TaxID=3231716 RepID=UPI003877EA97
MTYDAARIEVLEGREAVRKRPGMYVGSTGERGLHHLVFDVVDPAVADVLAGRASRVDVVLLPDGGVRVSDDGPGEEASLEDRLKRLHVGPDPVGRLSAPVSMFSGGLFVANVLSRRFIAEVRRDGACRVQEYERGVARGPFTATSRPVTGTGTTLASWPDLDVFETVECSYDRLAERFRELAYLHRGLEITLTDERPAASAPHQERFRSDNGLRDLVADLDARLDAPADIIGFAWADPRMEGTAEVALRWSGAHVERLVSFANSRLTQEGGTHVVGLHEGIAAAVDAYARERGLPAPAGDRLGEGLTAVVAVALDHPEYEGCTRTRLANPAVRAGVAEAVQEHLGARLKADPDRADALIRRIATGSSGT